MAQLTYEQIAQRLGISQARVQQLEAAALKKLRRELERQGVRAEDVADLPPPPDKVFANPGDGV